MEGYYQIRFYDLLPHTDYSSSVNFGGKVSKILPRSWNMERSIGNQGSFLYEDLSMFLFSLFFICTAKKIVNSAYIFVVLELFYMKCALTFLCIQLTLIL